MNLFLVVWTMQDWDDLDCYIQIPEWTHIVSNKPYLSTSDEEKIIIDFMKENHEYTRKETLDSLQNFWSNKIEMVDGYKVELEKPSEVDPEAFHNFLGMNPEEELKKLTIRKDQQ